MLAFEIYGFSGSSLNILYLQENVKVVFIFVSHIDSPQWECWNNQWWWSDISVFLFIKLSLFTPCICDLIQISQCLQQFCLTELPVMKEMFCAGATFGRDLKCDSWDWETEFLLVLCFNWCKLQQPHGAIGYRMGRAGVPVCAAGVCHTAWQELWLSWEAGGSFPTQRPPCPRVAGLLHPLLWYPHRDLGRNVWSQARLWGIVHTETWRPALVSGLPTTLAHAAPSPCLSLL